MRRTSESQCGPRGQGSAVSEVLRLVQFLGFPLRDRREHVLALVLRRLRVARFAHAPIPCFCFSASRTCSRARGPKQSRGSSSVSRTRALRPARLPSARS
eukprot:3821953-Rhodomonas_salina.1